MGLTLTADQFSLVYNFFSLAIAAMGSAFVYFLLTRTSVHEKYRLAVTISSLVVLVAFYHYMRIFDSWNHAFIYDPQTMTYTSGLPGTTPFNEGYRYVDWLITVPLLLTELVLVLKLDRMLTRSLLTKLIIAAVAMIVLGYPGEISPTTEKLLDFGPRGIWGILSTIPFLYILYVLFTELTKAASRQSDAVKDKMFWLRIIVVATWGFYPIAYIVPMVIADAALAEVIRQVGYSVADILAKPLFGLFIVGIAMIKSEEEKAAA
ncbi:MAG: bacteriorhodopsin-like [Chloroflexota bacterium]